MGIGGRRALLCDRPRGNAPEAAIDAGKLPQIRLVVSAGVKIVGLAKALPADGALSLTLDFDAAESIHEAGPNDVMRPTIKVVNNGDRVVDNGSGADASNRRGEPMGSTLFGGVPQRA